MKFQGTVVAEATADPVMPVLVGFYPAPDHCSSPSLRRLLTLLIFEATVNLTFDDPTSLETFFSLVLKQEQRVFMANSRTVRGLLPHSKWVGKKKAADRNICGP
jgi:hypothetical protein